MSFGFGNQGQIRYQLVIDDAGATGKIGSFKNALGQLIQPSQDVNTQLGAIGTNLNETSLGSKIKANIGNFSNLAIGLSATATSALQLGAGFRDFNDAQIAVERVTRKLSLANESLTKAQDKLNGLQKAGVTSGKDYEQAQLDVQQAQQQVSIQTQLLGESQERLFDSQTQFAVSVIPTVLGAVGTLGTAWKEFGGIMKATGSTVTGFGSAFKTAFGIGGPIALAIGAAALIINHMEDFKARTDKLFTKGNIFDPESMKASADQWDELQKTIGGGGVSILEFDRNTAGVMERFKKAGGEVDKFGKIIVKTFDLPPNFKDSSQQWIKWMTNYRLAGESNEQILARLKAATFDDATATKIATAADQEYTLQIDKQTASQKKVYEQISKTMEILPDYNSALHNSSSETALSIKFAKQYTGEIDSQFDSLFKEAMQLGLTTQELKFFADAQDKGALAAQHANDVLADLNTGHKDLNTFIKDEIPKLNDLKTARDLDNTELGETMKLMEDAAPKAREFGNAVSEAWKKAFAEIRKMPLISAALDIKIDRNAIGKKILDSIPDSVEKDIKIDLNTAGSIEAAKQGIEETLAFAVDQIDYKDAKVDSVVEGLMSYLQTQFPNSKSAEDMRKELAATIAGDDTKQKVQKLLAKWEGLQVPVEAQVVGVASGQGSGVGNVSAENEITGAANKFVLGSASKPVGVVPVLAKVVGYTGLNMPKGAIGVNEMGQYVDRNGKVVGQYGANINIPGGTLPSGKFPGGAYGGSNQQMSPFPTSVSMITQGSNKTPEFDVIARQINQITKNLNIFARAIITVTKDMSTWARATVTTTADNNQLARTVTQLTKDNNVYAKTIVTTYKDISVLAKATVTTTADNNQLARTTAQITKDNNTYAKTIVQVTKDINVLAKATVQETKDNNTLARTINQVGKNFSSAANDAKDFAKGLIAVAAAAKKAASAINSIPSGGIQGAQHGMHQQLSQDTLILAHKGERVDIGPGHQQQTSNSGGGGTGSITVNLTNVLADREITRTFRREIGRNFYRFGPS